MLLIVGYIIILIYYFSCFLGCYLMNPDICVISHLNKGGPFICASKEQNLSIDQIVSVNRQFGKVLNYNNSINFAFFFSLSLQ